MNEELISHLKGSLLNFANIIIVKAQRCQPFQILKCSIINNSEKYVIYFSIVHPEHKKGPEPRTLHMS